MGQEVNPCMMCWNCFKEVKVEGWLFVKQGGPEGKHDEVISEIAKITPTFCSAKCAREKEARDKG
jgi:hypothetical protein